MYKKSLFNLKPLKFLFFCITFMLLTAETAFAAPQVVYFPDNRVFVKDAPALNYFGDLTSWATSSICFFIENKPEYWNKLNVVQAHKYVIPYPSEFEASLSILLTQYLENILNEGQQQKHTCSPNVNFKEQYILPIVGTGVLVGDREILTVDHIFRDENGNPKDPSNYYAVFGWVDKNTSGGTVRFNVKQVCGIVGYDEYNNETLKQIRIKGSSKRMDISIVKTDRVMEDIYPINIYKSIGNELKNELINNQTELFMIGHCLCLPQIYADDGCANKSFTLAKAVNYFAGKNLIEENYPLSQEEYDRLIFTNLDGFIGNSGSPVFAKTEKYGYSFIGIFGGGYPSDFELDEKGQWIEKQFTQTDLDFGEGAEFIELLQDVEFDGDCKTRSFRKGCNDECDCVYMQKYVSPTPSTPPTPKLGECFNVQLPYLTDIKDGIYFLRFTGSYSKKIFYSDHWPSPSTCSGWIEYNHPYYICLIDLGGTMYWFYKNGLAQKNCQKPTE